MNKLKFLALLAPLFFIACTPATPGNEYTYEAPVYKLVFDTDLPVEWTINGQKGSDKTVDVSDYSEVEVSLRLAKAANVTCVLHKGQYPVNYYVATCKQSETYRFTMKVKE